MKTKVTTREYLEYRDATNGCLSVKQIYYKLFDKDTGQVLLCGDLQPTEEARQLVLGTHPSGNQYSSVILSAVDLYMPQIRAALDATVTKQELESVNLLDTKNSSDSGVVQPRRAKAIVWSVQYIDNEEHHVWIEGVI